MTTKQNGQSPVLPILALYGALIAILDCNLEQGNLIHVLIHASMVKFDYMSATQGDPFDFLDVFNCFAGCLIFLMLEGGVPGSE